MVGYMTGRDFPHGTPAGFDAGCKDASCPGSDRGQTCRQAAVRYRGDYSYRRLVDSGAPVEQLQEPERFEHPNNSNVIKARARLIDEINPEVDPEPEPEADDDDANPMLIMRYAV